MKASSTADFLAHFSTIADPRRDHKKLHELVDILFLSTCAVLAGADGPTEIAAFGHDRIDWLRKFVPLSNGIPSHNTIGRIFSLIKPATFAAAFSDWVLTFFPESPVRHSAKELRMAIDGKALRGSANRRKGVSALHLISAWSLEYQATLGVKAVEEKSNEITAIPVLLQELELRGAIITIDAMGCQRDIAHTIIQGGGEYILAVKENHPRLFEAIVEAFDRHADQEILARDRTYHQVSQRGHGRQEHRSYQMLRLPTSFKEEWPGLRSIAQATAIIQRNGTESAQTRYFISSMKSNVVSFAESVRGHWQIENRLHWVLDMSFGEDACRIQHRTAAENFGVLRRFTHAVLQQEPSKTSLISKRRRANRSTAFLETVLFSNALMR